MHRIEGLNFSLDSLGRHIFKDSPPATTVPAAWLNSVQEEISNAVEAAGLVLSSQNADQKNQLAQAISKQNVYDYVVSSNQGWYNIIERTAVNTYQFKSGYISIYFKNITGGYSINTVLTGGDTWGVIKTNGITNLEFESGAYINVGDTPSYMEMNTEGGYYQNIGLKGIGTVAAAISQSFHLNNNYVQFIGCWTSDRNSNVEFSGFRGSGTALHNYTSKYINCMVKNFVGSDLLMGFNGTKNLVNCLVTSSYSTSVGSSFLVFFDCENMNNCIAYGNDGSTFLVQMFYFCLKLTNCIAINNNNTRILGFSVCQQATNCLASNNMSATALNVMGFNSCIGIVNCESKSNGNTGAGGGYGFFGCTKMQQNKGSANKTATYDTSYADSGAGNACADTAAGGYNS